MGAIEGEKKREILGGPAEGGPAKGGPAGVEGSLPLPKQVGHRLTFRIFFIVTIMMVMTIILVVTSLTANMIIFLGVHL